MATMTRDERQAAERASMLHLYREAETVWQEQLEDGSDARVFLRNGTHYLVTFSGRSGKTTDHYRYRTADTAILAGQNFLHGRRAHAELMAKYKAARVSYRTTLTVGRVLVNSWGYDQTNIDYYQVVAVSPTGKTVTIRQIGARSVDEGYMQGSCWPLADHFIGAPMTKHVGEGDAVKIHDWGSWAHPWEPKADRWTAYA